MEPQLRSGLPTPIVSVPVEREYLCTCGGHFIERGYDLLAGSRRQMPTKTTHRVRVVLIESPLGLVCITSFALPSVGIRMNLNLTE